MIPDWKQASGKWPLDVVPTLALYNVSLDKVLSDIEPLRRPYWRGLKGRTTLQRPLFIFLTASVPRPGSNTDQQIESGSDTYTFTFRRTAVHGIKMFPSMFTSLAKKFTAT